MKAYILSIFILLFGSNLMAFDEAKLEKTLNDSFDEIVDEYSYLSSSNLNFDSVYTDIASGKLLAEFNMTTTPLLANANDPIVLRGSLRTNLVESETEGKKVFKLNGEIALEGRTLLILKTVSENFGECSIIPIDDIVEEADHINNILCFVLDGINEADRVTDLEKSLQAATNYAKQVYADNAEANSTLAQAFSSLKILPSESDLLATLGLKNAVFNLNLDVLLSIKEEGIFLNFEGDAELLNDEVDQYIEAVTVSLTEFENPESEAHIAFKEQMFFTFAILEAFLIPSDDDEDDF